MTNLREARETGKMAKFMNEHKGEVGDAGAFERTLSAMAGTPSKHKPDKAE